MLTDRQLEILFSIVYEYIQSGESVGSRTVSKRYMTAHSPATIRNEMADLEDMGYLLQPHASAGRMPTTPAYRLYWDSLLKHRKPISKDNADALNSLEDSRKGIETHLLYASELLGTLSSYMGIAAITQLRELRFKRVDFLRMSTSHMLLLLVLEGGYVHSQMVPMPCDISQDALEDLARKINSMEGLGWSEVKSILYSYVIQELGGYKVAFQLALDDLDRMMSSSTTQFATSSMRHLLNLPDFQDMARIKALMSIIEQEEELATLVQNCAKQDGVHAVIGDEHEKQDLKHCSLVVLSSTDEDRRLVFGVIGPQRMQYDKVVKVLDRVLLSFNHQEGKKEDVNGG